MAPNNKKGFGRVARFFRAVYLKLFRIDDTPQKIAAGFGLGVFFGVMPFMGPLIALFFAILFRVNRAGALLGSLLTNTWLSIPVFLTAVKTGASITGSNYADISKAWTDLTKHFEWSALFKLSALKIVFPVMLGYIIVSLSIGVIAYIITLAVIMMAKKKNGRDK